MQCLGADINQDSVKRHPFTMTETWADNHMVRMSVSGPLELIM